MNLLNFIANNWDSILFVGGALGLWKTKKTKQVNLGKVAETAEKLGRQAFTRLLHDPNLYDVAHVRKVITDTVWDGLALLEIEREPAIEKLVATAVEHVIGELAALTFKYNVGQLQKPLQNAAAAIEKLPEGKAIGLEAPAQ